MPEIIRQKYANKNCNETGLGSPEIEKQPPEARGAGWNGWNVGPKATLPKCSESFFVFLLGYNLVGS